MVRSPGGGVSSSCRLVLNAFLCCMRIRVCVSRATYPVYGTFKSVDERSNGSASLGALKVHYCSVSARFFRETRLTLCSIL